MKIMTIIATYFGLAIIGFWILGLAIWAGFKIIIGLFLVGFGISILLGIGFLCQLALGIFGSSKKSVSQ